MPDPRLGPWPLHENRVGRFYRGGALLEAFRGAAATEAHDGDRPEDWVGSATRSWAPPGAPRTDEGLSRVTLDGRDVAIADLLADDPAAIAGSDFVKRAGPSTGLLVKLLDAGIRLPVHAHPTRAFARRHLGSYFGKAEAWIVIAAREIEGQPAPHVRLGFRRDIGREELRDLIEHERSADLLDSLHQRPARPGDVWFVPPGTPHAIGAGLLIVEIQEPTDFSIVAEPGGFPIDVADAHLRRGWDLMLDVFDRRATDTPALSALHARPTDGADPAPIARGLTRVRLTPAAADPFFRAERWTVDDADVRPIDERAFLVAVVTGGDGEARVPAGGPPLAIRRGTTFAVPATALPDLVLAGDGLQLIACLPPRPSDLDA